MKIERDVIIVGAGIAGGICAAYLAGAGADVLLLEKEIFPRDKACGDILREGMVTHLSRLDLFGKLDDNGTLLRRLHIMSENGSECIIPFEGYAAPRFQIDSMIAEAAIKRGTEFRDGCRVRSLICEDGWIKGVSVREKGADFEIRSRLVILADGAGSLLKGQLGMTSAEEKAERFTGSGEYIGERAYFAGINLEEVLAKGQYNAYGAIGFHKDLPGGGYWIVPSGRSGIRDGYCNVGIVREADGAEAVSAEEVFAGLFERNKRVASLFLGARQVSPWKRAMLRDVTAINHRCGNGYLIIGDAGSIMMPFIKDGCSAAADSGEAAAIAAKEAIRANDFSAEYLTEEYVRRIEPDKTRLKFERITAESLHDPYVSNPMISRMVNNPTYTKRVLRELFG
ncbi:MAG: NAD(P)/FAD-dependent oxidoreductase [Firmicutes bacterium]|nr:NAD(P)/FAD-dependent oxidoreductase [Bacillota bacterium]MBQ9708719.1 NAD(P)/FAD-dependent oxidoreductase [Bacillota bacterium]